MSDGLIAFRAANFETPLWTLPNPQAGRYNEAGTAATQYLALHPLTPWAEVLRNAGQTTPEQARGLRVAIWVLRVTLDEEPVQLTYETAPAWGLAPEDLVADDHGPCRDLARRLREDDGVPSVLIAPSAALPGTRNLVILEERVDVGYHEEPIDIVDVPAALASQDGHAADGLSALVHHKGVAETHPELEAWIGGDEYELEQPRTVFAS